MVQFYDIQRVKILINQNEDRIKKEDVLAWDTLGSIDFDIDKININNMGVFELFKIIQRLNYKHIALPLGHHYIFYMTFMLLNGNYNKIHISDGLIDTFPLFESILGTRYKNTKGLIKSLFLYPILKFVKADICFFQLYPFKSCHSKWSNPVLQYNRPISEEFFKNQELLIIPTETLNIGLLKEKFAVENYISTSKERKIIINDREHILEQFITAEDVLLNVSSIKMLITTPSSVVFFTKINRPDVEIICCTDGMLNNRFGKTYETSFIKLCKAKNIKVIQF